MSAIEGVPAPNKVVYNDFRHTYYMDGVRARGASTVAKIPTDTFTLDLWVKRMVAAGMALDPNLIERIAVDPENKALGDAVAEDALRAAKAHLKADRGTQMHKVLELVLLNQLDRLLTAQQRADADVLRRTLDRYKLTPHDGMAEQFIAWPFHVVGGRFDCILCCPDGRLVLTDLKSGPNAVAYPQSTACQLALYARAPWMSDGMEVDGDKTIITKWRKMPERLDRSNAYVLLVKPDDTVGTLHEIDIEYGWAGAQIALEIVTWRKGFSGRAVTREVPDQAADQEITATFGLTMVSTALSVDHLRQLWKQFHADGVLTPEVKAAIDFRREQLEMTA
jgi:hypothetical protein